MQVNNLELVEENVKNYKNSCALLESYQDELNEISLTLKAERKNDVAIRGKNEQIIALNERRNKLKDDIALLKKQIKKAFSETESLIFSSIKSCYNEMYEKQLSRLYGYKVDVLVKEPGDLYDEETCIATTIIVTRNKKQHKKIVKMLDFGIRDKRTYYTEKKVKVEVCIYSKKHLAGEVLPYDRELLKWKNINF